MYNIYNMETSNFLKIKMYKRLLENLQTNKCKKFKNVINQIKTFTKENSILNYEKNGFIKIFKNLARYRFKNIYLNCYHNNYVECSN